MAQIIFFNISTHKDLCKLACSEVFSYYFNSLNSIVNLEPLAESLVSYEVQRGS